MYDPTLAADRSDLVSAGMRSQLAGLKDLIDAILTITAALIGPCFPAAVNLVFPGMVSPSPVRSRLSSTRQG